MNFERSYVSNLPNLFESTGTGENEQGLFRQTSPKVANFENRPILSYTIPTNDCTSPKNSKLSPRQFEYRKILSKSEAKVSEIGKYEESNSLKDGVMNGNNKKACNTKNYSIQSKENDHRLSRNQSLRLNKDEVQTNFLRLTSNRRSLQQGVRLQTSSINRSIDRNSKLSPQVTKEDFVSRMSLLRNKNRSKSSQRDDETLKVCEDDELLTDQTLPCLGFEAANVGGKNVNNCGTHGSGMLRIRNLMSRTGTESHIIREGVVSSSSSSSPPPEIINNRNQNNLRVRRTLSMHSSDQSTTRMSNYSNDDINNNNNNIINIDNKRTNQFKRFGSLRMPSSSSSSSSPFVKRRISFALDQHSENSSENDFSMGDSNVEVRSLFENLNSANWQSRRESLSNIQAIMDQSPDILGAGELKRVTDSFTKMFHDPHSKVCSLFLELLPSFISIYSIHLPRHWLNVCLNKLFTKSGTELLGSIQVKIKKSLEAIRESFDCNQHFEAMNSLANNHALMHNSKSRESFVNHVKEFMMAVDPIDLCPCSDLTELVQGLIKLLERYQSIELKKNIQSILISMFDLSPPTFSAIMYLQSRDAQDFMTKTVRQHVSSLPKGCSSPSSSSSSFSFTSGQTAKFKKYQIDSHYSSSNSSDSAGPSTRNITSSSSSPQPIMKNISSSSSPHPIMRNITSSSSSQPTRPSSLSIDGPFPSRIPQRIESPLKNFPKHPPRLRNSPSTELNSSTSSLLSSSSSSQPSSSPSILTTTPQLIRKVSLNRSKLFDNINQDRCQQNQQSVACCQQNRPSLKPDRKEHFYNDCTDEEYLAAEFDVFVEQFSNIDLNNKVEWKQALKQLVHQLPSKPDLIKDVHLTSLLSVLLTAPEDIDECSLIVAECLTTLLRTRRIDKSLLILQRILDASNPSNVLQTLRWIKFQLDGVAASEISSIVGDVVASVLKVSDSEDKSTRTVSIMVLVQIFRLVGDDIWIHLHDINNHKRALLQMYFKRPMKQ